MAVIEIFSSFGVCVAQPMRMVDVEKDSTTTSLDLINSSPDEAEKVEPLTKDLGTDRVIKTQPN